MTGGTMAMMFAMMFLVLIVAVIALLIYIGIKYAWIVPMCWIGNIVWKFTEKKSNKPKKK